MRAADVPVLILAGGRGTRIKHILGDLPKPMYPVLGKPFLDYQISYLRSFGFKKIFLSTGYRSEIIEDHFKDDPDVTVVRESKALGTGGAVLYFLKDVNFVKLMVLNGDTLFLMNYNSFIEFATARSGHSVLALKEVPTSSRYGSVKLDESKRLLSFSEKATGETGLINAGIYLLETSQLRNSSFPEVCSIETEVFPGILKKGLYGFETNADFIDIGTPETLGQIEDFVIKNKVTAT